MGQISARSKAMYRSLGLDQFSSLGLVRTALNGNETDAVAVIRRDENGDYSVEPILIVVTKRIFDQLLMPEA
jgi:hypothetical protein